VSGQETRPIDHGVAIGRIEGELKHIVADLATGRTRMHEMAQTSQRVETRLQTLLDTGIPQRERMLSDLAEIKSTVGKLEPLLMVVEKHGNSISSLEHFRTKALAQIGMVGGIAGLAATTFGLLVKEFFFSKGGH